MDFEKIVLSFLFISAHSTAGETNLLKCEYEEDRISALDLKRIPKDYDAKIKPLNLILHVFFLPIIEEFNTKTNLLTISTIIGMSWSDPKLNIIKLSSAIQLSESIIWTPTLRSLTENIDTKRTQPYLKLEKTVMYRDGTIATTSREHQSFYCKADLREYPFDTQICKVAWEFRDTKYKEIDFMFSKLLEALLDNEWTLVDQKHELNETKSDVLCSEPNTRLEFTLILRRNYHMHMYVFVWPIIVLMLLSLSLYWVPHKSKQRFNIGLGILWGQIILSAFCSRRFPSGLGTTTRLVSCLMYGYILLIITFINSVITFYLFYRCPVTQPIPATLKKILGNKIIGLITGVQIENNTADYLTSTNISHNESSSKDVVSSKEKLESTIKILHQQKKLQDLAEQNTQWKEIATVVDRLLFYIFGGLTFICAIVFYA